MMESINTVVSPLCAAAGWGHRDVVRSILDGGADIDQANWKGETPLYLAAVAGHKDVEHLLLEEGAKPDRRYQELGERKLWTAAQGCHSNHSFLKSETKIF